jgi:hypothetical protein
VRGEHEYGFLRQSFVGYDLAVDLRPKPAKNRGVKHSKFYSSLMGSAVLISMIVAGCSKSPQPIVEVVPIVNPDPTASATPSGPSLAFEPGPTINLGIVRLSGPNLIQGFRLLNRGGSPTETCGLLSLTGPNADEFRLSATQTCLTRIAAGGSCAGINVFTAAKGVGNKTATLGIACGVLSTEVVIEYTATDEDVVPTPTPVVSPTPIVTPTPIVSPTPIVTPTPAPQWGQCRSEDGSIGIRFYPLVTPFGLRTFVDHSSGVFSLYTKPFCAPRPELFAAAVSYVNPRYLHARFPVQSGTGVLVGNADICMGPLCPGRVPLVCEPAVRAMFQNVCSRQPQIEAMSSSEMRAFQY